MFSARIRLRASLLRPQDGYPKLLQRRSLIVIKSEHFQATRPIAKQLQATNIWKPRGAAKKKSLVKGDKFRVNCVSEELCDDVIKYIGPTLDRHKGCDIVDLFPGVGLWSRTMHDLLQPRSHILLEPDEELYTPFLRPLLERPGVRLIPESGIVWEDLNRALNPSTLPHQVERRYAPDETPERNDTLLVLANLSIFPKRKFRSFDSLAQLVLYQLISSIRPGALIQKYGLVRMLVWTADIEKFGCIPRTIQRRRRQAFETEINTDHVTEIAGADTANVDNNTQSARGFFRDTSIDMESMDLTYKRMKEAGFSPIPGRETQMLRDYLDLVAAGEKDFVAGEKAAVMLRPFRQELTELEAKKERGELKEGSEDWKRYKRVYYKANWTNRRQGTSMEVLKEMQDVEELWKKAHTAKAKTTKERAIKKAENADAEWNQRIDKLEKTLANEFLLMRDNLHVVKQDPPVLNWDRRYVDPLVVKDDEFFPAVPCSLLDIQPKAIEPVLREMGPGSSRAGDTFDILLRALMSYTTAPIAKALDGIYPGAAEAIIPNCPSLVDPATGGRYTKGYGELTARTLNVKQLVEIAEAWNKWPFKPDWPELVARSSTEDTVENYEGESQSTSRWDF
ncbi:S-adenosyl-L-methionine-dependent methyltransferase [Cladorrhinum sp. PSN259]|nr:S-adenosyl-L-methionine-dependent methyltransferase [Cladorrhinum sp. PSN259]